LGAGLEHCPTGVGSVRELLFYFNRDGSDGENRENMDRRSWVVRNNTLLA
jgi:hypothetical protein